MITHTCFSTTTDRKSINEARHLLYEHYMNELCWEVKAHNPSAIKVIPYNDSKNILVDDYDSLSTWFVGINQESVIACARLCGDDDNGLLEVERYTSARLVLQKILQDKRKLNLVELNREAIHVEHRNYQTYLLLLKTILKHCILRKQSILMTTPNSDLIHLYKLISFPKIEYGSFKYDPSEPTPVNTYIAEFDKNHHQNMIKNINYFLNLEDGYDYKTFGATFI